MIKTFRVLLAVSALLFATSAAACGLTEKTAAGYENASLAHAYDHWQQGEASPIPFVFLDVRTPEEYASGHVPGARLVPVQELADRMGEVPKDRQVYVYCEAGVRSTKAAEMLATAGFTNIENVPDSMAGWRSAGYPVEK